MNCIFCGRFYIPLYRHISYGVKFYSAGSTVSALRPFLLAVHPDFLWQHPEKRVVNENSLKQLNQFLEKLQKNDPCDRPTSLQFYLKNNSTDQDHQLVNIKLGNQNIDEQIRNILTACNISIPLASVSQEDVISQICDDEFSESKFPFYKKIPVLNEEKLKNRVAKAKGGDLIFYLSTNSKKVHGLFRSANNGQRETIRLSNHLKEHLKLKDIVWHNQWSPQIHRSCILDFKDFCVQYHESVGLFTGRTIVFGDETGIRLDGSIVLGSRDSRLLWVELAKNLPKENALLLKVRKCEQELQDKLPGTKISYGLLKGTVNLGKHLYWLEKLNSLLNNHFYKNCTPALLPIENQRVIIDCESDEMRLLDTGEITICPRLPASEVLNFLNANFDIAKKKQELFLSAMSKEADIQEDCARKLKLGSLLKDELLSIENMVASCQKMIDNRDLLVPVTQNLHICVTTYYKILSEGIICIPWNWKCFKNTL